MNIDDKLKRLQELKKEDFHSDEEFKEMEKLEDEIRLITLEADKPIETIEVTDTGSFKETKVDLGTGKGYVIPIKPKHSMLRTILRVKQKEIPKPVTNEELTQLTLEARKQEILARIAKAKADQVKHKSSSPSIFQTIQKVIGKSDNNPFSVGTNARRKKQYDPWSW